MVAPRRTRMALVLLLALLAQPAWAVAHVVVHDHLTHHPDHHGESGSHDHAGHDVGHHAPSHAPRAPETSLEGDELLTSNAGHDHDHDHFDATFVRRADSTGEIALAAIPAEASRVIEPAVGRRVESESQPSRASPAHANPSRPRAPPHA